jgi:deoxyribodipyrimidine photo-lyase
LADLEGARTHDHLWNATQTELEKIGKIRGSLREYWAIKILEWSPSPEEAFEAAIYLNDRYGLDARDPNGYTGIAMVIGGLYGKPWGSKDVVGKIKRMTYTGERLRYDVHAYMEYVKGL